MHVLKVTNNIEKLERARQRREERKSKLLQKVSETNTSLVQNDI